MNCLIDRKPDPEWPKLIGAQDLPAIELIKDLNPKNKTKYSSNLFKDSCNGIWKEYF